MDLTTTLSAVLLGGFVGLLQTLVGLGGGVAMVPLLPIIAGVSPRVAVATSLMSMGPIAVINAVRLTRRHQIVWSRSMPIGLAAAVSAWWAARATGVVAPKTLVIAYSLVVGVMAFQVLSRPAHERYSVPRWFDIPVGAFAGLVSGFTGVSGGVVNTPYLSRVRDVPEKKVVPTSLGAFALIAVSGAMSFFFESDRGQTLIRMELVVPIVAGAVLSSAFGIRLQSRLSHRLRLAVLGVLLLGLCVQSFYKAMSMS